MKTILFIGPINKGSIPSGGQVAKNQAFLEYFEKKYKVVSVDTNGWLFKPYVWVKFILGIFLYHDLIVVSLSSNSAYRIIRILYYFGKDKKAVYLVVGGWFDKMLASNQSRLKYYSGLKAIKVQSQMMEKEIKNLGVSQVSYFPNFRRFEPFDGASETHAPPSECKKYLYLSRIGRDKGASIVLDALEIMSLEEKAFGFDVDFYGAVDADFKHEFFNRIDHLDFAHYKGLIDLRDMQNYKLLKAEKYAAFLFCTTFIGEGFPGAVLDAMVIGVPVIATDWNYNSEVIRDDVDGIIIPPNDKQALIDAIKKISLNSELEQRYSKSLLSRASDFNVDKVLGDFEKQYLC